MVFACATNTNHHDERPLSMRLSRTGSRGRVNDRLAKSFEASGLISYAAFELVRQYLARVNLNERIRPDAAVRSNDSTAPLVEEHYDVDPTRAAAVPCGTGTSRVGHARPFPRFRAPQHVTRAESALIATPDQDTAGSTLRSRVSPPVGPRLRHLRCCARA